MQPQGKSSRGIEIIAVGDEILRGEVQEYNTLYISQALTAVGLEPWKISILPDEAELLSEELCRALDRSRIVIVTGGLGPTADDVTKKAAVRALGAETEMREDVVRDIENRFLARVS